MMRRFCILALLCFSCGALWGAGRETKNTQQPDPYRRQELLEAMRTNFGGFLLALHREIQDDETLTARKQMEAVIEFSRILAQTENDLTRFLTQLSPAGLAYAWRAVERMMRERLAAVESARKDWLKVSSAAQSVLGALAEDGATTETARR